MSGAGAAYCTTLPQGRLVCRDPDRTFQDGLWTVFVLVLVALVAATFLPWNRLIGRRRR